jgi:lysozyme family protein
MNKIGLYTLIIFLFCFTAISAFQTVIYAQGTGQAVNEKLKKANESMKKIKETEDVIKRLDNFELNIDISPTSESLPNNISQPNPTINQAPNTPLQPPQNNNLSPLGSRALERLLPQANHQNSASIQNSVRTCANSKMLYEEVERLTGVPWKLMAGLHYVEANCDSQRSCASGRAFGKPEPDRGINCAQNNTLGEPKPVGGGCGFVNLLDSCVFAANHLKRKAGQDLLSDIQTLTRAVSNYNGGGNRNCGRINNVTMPYCPAEYEGSDDIYTFKGYDEKREIMYLRYCDDGVLCNPPKPWGRIGVFTVVKNLTQLGF